MLQNSLKNDLTKNPWADPGFGIYIHWPYCLSKCPYCDFNSHVADSVDHDQWAQAFVTELKYYAEKTRDKTVSSIFFGGGTPSLMAPQTVETIITSISTLWKTTRDLEITLEANPTSIENDKLSAFKTAGINRVSIGIQSLDNKQLKFLGRQHNAQEALDAVEIAAKLFNRYSFDLIYARPKQTLESWQEELQHALQFSNGHLSLYQLTIEKGTAFYTQHQRGDFVIPKDDHGAALYELTQEIMTKAGLPAYEISNHASPGQESRHNLTYWRYGDYIGIGPGAHGRLTLDTEKYGTRAHRAPSIWLDKVSQQNHGAHPFEKITPSEQISELVMMGLRLNEKIYFERLSDITGHPPISRDRLKQLAQEGYLTVTEAYFQSTPQGWQRLNALLKYLLA